MPLERRALIMVGHHGRGTGTWFEDQAGRLDEHEEAHAVAIATAFELQTRAWRTGIAAMPGGNNHHLYRKGRMLDDWRPSLAIEIHFNALTRPGKRQNRWPGCSGPAFGDGHIPDERVQGLSLIYYEGNHQAELLAKHIAGRIRDRAKLPLLHNTGLDPRPDQGAGRIYLTTRVDPDHRRPRFPTPGWPGCPVLLLEAGFLTSPDDRRRIRDPFFANRLAVAVAEGCDRWQSAIAEAEEPA